MIEAFKTLEDRYWELYRPVFLEQYINPLNIAEEKEKFSKAWHENKVYNPQFTYQSLDFDLNEVCTKFKGLKESFNKSEHPLDRYYIEHIDRTTEALQHFANRETKVFATWLTTQYGRPSRKLVQQAEKMLSRLGKVAKEEQSVSAFEVSEIFAQALEERDFVGWEILIEEMPARMSINQMQKKVKIKASAKFSHLEIARLKVHEIDTHILRAENAKKQPYLLFQYGFPGYLKTEEGLAILSEAKHDLLTEYDQQKYALRVLASDYACDHDFYDVFIFLTRWLDDEDAFAMTVRVKRGLANTEDYGAYTKDQVYLDGYLMLKEEPLSNIAKLYYGKIGMGNIGVLAKLDKLEESIIYPEWV